MVKITVARVAPFCYNIIPNKIKMEVENMRAVILDNESGTLSVYNVGAVSCNEGYIILGFPGWRGFFPVSRFRFVGLDERGLLK